MSPPVRDMDRSLGDGGMPLLAQLGHRGIALVVLHSPAVPRRLDERVDVRGKPPRVDVDHLVVTVTVPGQVVAVVVDRPVEDVQAPEVSGADVTLAGEGEA